MVVNVPWTDTATAADDIFHGSNSGTAITYAPYSSDTATSTWVTTAANGGKFYLGTQNPAVSSRLNFNGDLYAKTLTAIQGIDTSSLTIKSTNRTKIYLYSDGLSVGDIDSFLGTLYGDGSIKKSYSGGQYEYTLPNKTGTIALTNDIPYVNMTYTAGTSGSANTTTWSYRAAGATGDPLTVTFNNITTAEINALFS